MELLNVLCQANQTITVDTFKIISSVVMFLLSALIGLNSFWVKKYISDNKEVQTKMDLKFSEQIKELGKKFDVAVKALTDTFNKFHEGIKEEGFQLQLKHENVKKDVVGLEKRFEENLKLKQERLDKHSTRIDGQQTDITILKEFMATVNEKIENMSKDVNRTIAINQIVAFLQDQVNKIQEQINKK